MEICMMPVSAKARGASIELRHFAFTTTTSTFHRVAILHNLICPIEASHLPDFHFYIRLYYVNLSERHQFLSISQLFRHSPSASTNRHTRIVHLPHLHDTTPHTTMATPPQEEESSTQQQQPYREIAATQIRHLSTLSHRIPGILTTSATTLSQLTNAPIPPASLPTTPDAPSARRAALSTSANAFYTSVLDLRAALHAQIDELEKHGVIPADELRFKGAVQQVGSAGSAGAATAGADDAAAGAGSAKEKKGDPQASVTNNGLGSFDVGVLNARAGVRQRDGEEVLARMKRVVDGLVEQAGVPKESGDEDQDMKDG